MFAFYVCFCTWLCGDVMVLALEAYDFTPNSGCLFFLGFMCLKCVLTCYALIFNSTLSGCQVDMKLCSLRSGAKEEWRICNRFVSKQICEGSSTSLITPAWHVDPSQLRYFKLFVELLKVLTRFVWFEFAVLYISCQKRPLAFLQSYNTCTPWTHSHVQSTIFIIPFESQPLACQRTCQTHKTTPKKYTRQHYWAWNQKPQTCASTTSSTQILCRSNHKTQTRFLATLLQPTPNK